MDDIRECPFCGGKAEFQSVGASQGSYCIKCLKCWAKSIFLRGEGSKDELIKAWNTRHEDKNSIPLSHVPMEECPECKGKAMKLIEYNPNLNPNFYIDKTVGRIFCHGCNGTGQVPKGYVWKKCGKFPPNSECAIEPECIHLHTVDDDMTCDCASGGKIRTPATVKDYISGKEILYEL